MPMFGKKSLESRSSCHSKLKEILDEAIKVYDFSILEGHRDEETQNKLYDEGKSKLRYPNSKHNKMPSLAVDIAPYPIDWNNRERFARLAGLMFGIAHSKGIKIRWGGTWGSLGDKNKSDLFDLPHFELILED